MGHDANVDRGKGSLSTASAISVQTLPCHPDGVTGGDFQRSRHVPGDPCFHVSVRLGATGIVMHSIGGDCLNLRRLSCPSTVLDLHVNLPDDPDAKIKLVVTEWVMAFEPLHGWEG